VQTLFERWNVLRRQQTSTAAHKARSSWPWTWKMQHPDQLLCPDWAVASNPKLNRRCRCLRRRQKTVADVMKSIGRQPQGLVEGWHRQARPRQGSRRKLASMLEAQPSPRAHRPGFHPMRALVYLRATRTVRHREATPRMRLLADNTQIIWGLGASRQRSCSPRTQRLPDAIGSTNMSIETTRSGEQ
jgi:hypothetical protein